METPNKIRFRLADPILESVCASQEMCVALEPYVNVILDGVQQVTGLMDVPIEGKQRWLVTDRSLIGNMLCSTERETNEVEDCEALGKVLGIPVSTDMLLIDLAAQLKTVGVEAL